MEYDLFCTIGNTIYFFNSGLPKEELLDEDGDICIAPCDVLDWMEAKIGDEIGDDGITHWGHFDEIRLMKGKISRKKVKAPAKKAPAVPEEHLPKMREVILQNNAMGNKTSTINTKLHAYLEVAGVSAECVDKNWIQSVIDEATAGVAAMTVKEEDGAK